MIALVAGAGELPLLACKSLEQSHKPFFVISLTPENNYTQLCDATTTRADVIAEKFYKLGSVLELLKTRGATHLVMIGKVDKRNLLKKVKFDWLTTKLLASLITKSDREIQETLVSFVESQGIQVLKQSDVLSSLLVQPGVLCGEVTDAIKTDITFGMEMALKISEYDIGQTVAMKDRMIIAVEAIEGTDECIKRAISLGGSNIVICKAARTSQNKKYDLPTLGTQSLACIKKGEVAAIAWQSTQTLIPGKDQFIAAARDLGITLVSV